jgi:predicted AlkP superfamily pyrophosphatase or phosphodiesterase
VTALGQKHQNNAVNEIARPKLMIGIVVDQMRWDYLYRYYDLYSDGGFKRLLREGFSFENAMINYIPSFTAVGYSTIYTGSVPSIDGIAGNTWYDFRSARYTCHCTHPCSTAAYADAGWLHRPTY